MSLCIVDPFARLSPRVNKYPTNLPTYRSNPYDVLLELAGFRRGPLQAAVLILLKSNRAAIRVAGIFYPTRLLQCNRFEV